MRPFFTILALILTLTLSCLASDLPNWEKLNTPEGALIYYLAEGKSGAIFAISESDSLYKSTNDGQSWTEAPDTIKDSDYYVNQLYSLNNGNLFQAKISQHMLYKSTDNGISWSAFDTAKTKNLSSIFTDNKNNLYLCKFSRAIDIYSDETGTWSRTDTIENGSYVDRLVVDNDGTIFSQMNKSLYYSTDRKTWIRTNIPDSLFTSIELNSKGGLLASTYKGRIYLSTDKGKTWERKFNDTNLYIANITYLRNKVLLANIYDRDILRSSDDGQTWQRVGGLAEMQYFTGFKTSKSGKIFASGMNGVYISSDDGLTWTRSANGIKGVRLNSILVARDNSIFVGSTHGVFRSTDMTKTWSFAPVPTYSIDKILESPKGTLVATYSRDAFISKDRGQSWQKITNYQDSVIKSSFDVAIDSTGALYIFSNTPYIQKSTDDGQSWTLSKFGNKPYLDIKDVAFDRNKILICYNGLLFESTDNGTSWNELLNTYSLNSIYISPNDDLYAWSQSGMLFKSTDNGRTWADLKAGLDIISGNPNSLAFTDKGELICSVNCWKDNRNNDIYRNGEGSSWSRAGNGLRGKSFSGRNVATNKDHIFATVSSNLYRLANPTFNNRFTISVSPADTALLDWKDSLKFQVSIKDDKGAPIDSALTGINDSLNKTRNLSYSNNGKAEYMLKVPKAIADTTYKITFKAMADGFINNPEETCYIRVKHSAKWKMQVFIEPAKDTINVDIKDSAYATFRAFVTDCDKDTSKNAQVVIIDGLADIVTDCYTNTRGWCTYAASLEDGKPLGVYSVKFIGNQKNWSPSDTAIRYINFYNSTGVDEKAEENTDLRISPDADNGTTTLFFFNSTAGEARFEIYNILGEKVISEARELPAGYCVETLNTGHLTAGGYYIKVYGAGRIMSGKFLIGR